MQVLTLLFHYLNYWIKLELNYKQAYLSDSKFKNICNTFLKSNLFYLCKRFQIFVQTFPWFKQLTSTLVIKAVSAT